ncbi:MAG: FAD-dependent oxidoreductase, partial [Actinomycetota bacterium]
MSAPATIVIVGASLAGARAAETLRDEGFAGRVVLLGEEDEPPYERPPLSKTYLRGESERAAARVHPEGFYAERGIELRTGVRVDALDAAAGTVMLADGERLRFDRLLLATGAAPRRLPVPGADLDGVLLLRTLPDSDALRARLVQRPAVVVVGAGWIGCEVAASARQMGCEVTMLDVADLPLAGVLGPQMGAFYRDVHAANDVRFLGGTGVEAVEGAGRV